MTFNELNAQKRVCDRQFEVNHLCDEMRWKQDVFLGMLRELLDDRESLKNLTKRQLLIVLRWCSAYRPLSLHLILRAFARIAGE